MRRPADERVDRALELGLNVLLSAPRGAGATSLLYRVEGEHPERTVRLSLSGVADAVAALNALSNAIGTAPVIKPADVLRPPTVLDVVERRLDQRGVTTVRPMIVLVDGPLPPTVAHDLFGGLRDQLFALPMKWVVVAPAERVGEYVAAPADVFFEHVVHLDPFSPEGQMDLLERRDALSRLDPGRVKEIRALSDGMPRRTLALAREALLRPEAKLADRGYQEWLERQAALSRSAAMLFSEMQGREPTAANDPDLLQRLGWGEMRVRRAMQELVDQGLVRASQGRKTGPGRPPTVYHPAPGPPGYHEEVPLR